MTPQRPRPSRTATLARRTTVLLGTAAAVLATAGPAGADVPEGWSDPEPVNMLHALLVLGGIPLALFVLITALTYLPAMARGERVNPTAPTVENQWLGGPRKSTAELAAPDTETSEAGGASARW